MGPVIENLLVFLLEKVLTPEVIKGSEEDLIVFLKALAAKSPNGIDDAVVKLLAFALNVPY